MTLTAFWHDLTSPRGRFGRRQFLTGESIRGALLLACWLLVRADLALPAMLLLPFALWVGIVATIKRFNDLVLDPVWILLALTVIAAGIGIAWQWHSWPWALAGLVPYLLWVSLAPGR